MPERIQKQRPEPQKRQDVEAPAPKAQDTKLIDATDELLDEIDAILEENAEEFVANYVQQGGE